MAENGEHVKVDVEQLTYSDKTLKFDGFNVYGNCSIFKIPHPLFRQNEKAYVPDAFSIGPWHFGKEHLKPGQKFKSKYLERVLYRFPSPTTALEKLEAAVNEVEADARRCYAAPVGFTKQEFVKILVLDGCFIIELFNEYAGEVQSDDFVMAANCMIPMIHHDLLLLENQIPWFVLELLFHQIKFPTGKSLVELATLFFNRELSHSGFLMESNIPDDGNGMKNILHMIDFVRRFLILPPERRTPIWDLKLQKHTIPSISKLKEVGVRFRKIERANVLDINFNDADGVLEIPSLIITTVTESTLRNLISFEQCYPFCSPVVTCYAMLLDNLVDSPNDVELLCQHGIFNHWSNTEDVVQFFNKLHNEQINVDAFYYAEVCRKVNKYCGRWWRKWRAFLFKNYFGKPWAFIAPVYALIILVLLVLLLVLKWDRN